MRTTRGYIPRQRKPRDKWEPPAVVNIQNATWMREGSCHGVTTDIFFPELDDLPSDDARALCARCPVKEECLQWALEHDEEGYWGGTTRTQREAIMSGRHRVKCPGCGGREVVELHQIVCLACGLSW